MNHFSAEDAEAVEREFSPAVIAEFEQLRKRVERDADADGWCSIRASVLKTAIGMQRLRPIVRQNIARLLAHVGLVPAGTDIPDREYQFIKLRLAKAPTTEAAPATPAPREQALEEIRRYRADFQEVKTWLLTLEEGLDRAEQALLRLPA